MDIVVYYSIIIKKYKIFKKLNLWLTASKGDTPVKLDFCN